MIELNKKKVNYMKNEMQNYYFVMRMASSKLIEVDSKQKQYLSADQSIDTHCGVVSELRQADHEVDMLLLRTAKVSKFIAKLSKPDQAIMHNLYMSPTHRRPYDIYCNEVGMSKSTLQRHVDNLILIHWET